MNTNTAKLFVYYGCMSYEIGTVVPLNKIKKNKVTQAAEHLYSVGTHFSFRTIEGRLVAAIKVPVVFA